MSKVIVAGSINMDVVAKTSRHPLPGETVPGSGVRLIPGGKGANQAIASFRLGAETTLIGKVGADSFGQELCRYLGHTGLSLDHVKQVDGQSTGTALIVVDAHGENTIVVVPGANEMLLPDDVQSFECSRNDVLVAPFEIPLGTIEAFFGFGRKRDTINVLNPAPAQKIPATLQVLCDVVVLNETELEQLTGNTFSMANSEACCRSLRAFPNQVIVLTLGKDGVLALTERGMIREPGLSVNAIDTTGAGDCFVGALANRLARGATMGDAITFANRAAALSVTREGASISMPTEQEVNELT